MTVSSAQSVMDSSSNTTFLECPICWCTGEPTRSQRPPRVLPVATLHHRAMWGPVTPVDIWAAGNSRRWRNCSPEQRNWCNEMILNRKKAIFQLDRCSRESKRCTCVCEWNRWIVKNSVRIFRLVLSAEEKCLNVFSLPTFRRPLLILSRNFET